MKVMVTGGAGFIGSHIVDAMLAAGHDVCVVDDLSTGHRENVDPRARLYEVDIRDEAALEAVFAQEEPEVISHQAAKANVRESMVRPVLYAEVNILGSLNILEAARHHQVRKIIYASTGVLSMASRNMYPPMRITPSTPSTRTVPASTRSSTICTSMAGITVWTIPS